MLCYDSMIQATRHDMAWTKGISINCSTAEWRHQWLWSTSQNTAYTYPVCSGRAFAPGQRHWDILTLETQLHCKNVPKSETPRWLPIEVIVLVTLATLTLIGWNVKKTTTKTIALSLSLSHTHIQFQNQLFANQNDECLSTWWRKTDLKMSRAFELEWVLQIQFIGQWSEEVLETA
jgi:hypothetical protein